MGQRGVLLPVASLPNGKFSDGYRFIDWLAANGYQYWQVLPLSPRDDFGSPYNSPDSSGIDFSYGTRKEWQKLRTYAHRHRIKIIGDFPFFVSFASKDYQNNKKYFLSDQISGVPPDAYSRQGQVWGHPQYDWQALASDGFRLFFQRLEAARQLYDIIRLDHFRGYQAVWSIPKGLKSAKHGRWVSVPGEELFAALRQKYLKEVFIAEDLGHITPAVENLRRKFGFLGSAIIQFGENNNEDIVYYSSNHDTPTLAGRFGKKKAKEYLQKVLAAPAMIKIIPVWDILMLGNQARYNYPGTKRRTNWRWRLSDDLFAKLIAGKV